MIEFIQKYFIDPIYQGTGYNVYNTIVYGLLLGVGIIAVDKLLHRLGINVDGRFYIATLPFLTLASILRSLADAGILPVSFFLVTPGIFLTMLLIVLGALAIARFLDKGYHKAMFLLGALVCIYPAFLLLENVFIVRALLYILAITALSSAIVLAFFSGLKLRREVLLVGVAHMLDASATFVGIEYYGYWEEHVFENFLIQLTGTALILFPLKAAALLLIIAVLERIEDNAFWYYAIFLLGYSPGLRDAFKIMLLG